MSALRSAVELATAASKPYPNDSPARVAATTALLAEESNCDVTSSAWRRSAVHCRSAASRRRTPSSMRKLGA